MNWVQFKDPVFNTCLAVVVVASWSITQEVTGSNHFEFSEFNESFRKNSIFV